MSLIPKEKHKAQKCGPKRLLIFSKPKTGKTTMLSKLEDNFMVVLDPGGADYADYWGVDVRREAELQGVKPHVVLRNLAGDLMKLPKKPKYGTIDTITSLEDVIIPLAGELYKATPMGVNWGNKPGEDDVRKLPNGAGYTYTRMAFSQVIEVFSRCFENIILVGHIKEKMLEKDGESLPLPI